MLVVITTAHLHKASLNSMDPILKIGRRYRRFMPREAARVQSFPDGFNLIGSDKAQYIALGNAVSPVMMWHISRSIMGQLRSLMGQKHMQIMA